MSRLSLSPSSPVPSLASSSASSPQLSPLASLPSSPASSLSDDEETCGHDFEFLEDLNEDYKCPVCLMAMNNPVQTKGCGHRCCRKCLLESFNRAEGDRRYCPKDRTPLPSRGGFYRDKALNRSILSLKVKCKQNDKGCDWTGELREYKNHSSICQYVSVSCLDCGEIMERSALDSHKASTCVQRIMSCDYCDEPFRFCNLKVHQDNECPLFPVHCPQKCGEEEMPRQQIDAHLRNHCPLTKIPCPFQICGCSVQEHRGKMSMHCQKNSIGHLYNACRQLHALKQKVSDYGILQQRVGRLEEEKVSMKHSLDMCNQEIRGLRATEREQRKKLSQMEHQLAELSKENKKTQLLVEEMKGTFQAIGNAFGLSNGKGQSKKAEVKKRKVEDKGFLDLRKKSRLEAWGSSDSSDSDSSPEAMY